MDPEAGTNSICFMSFLPLKHAHQDFLTWFFSLILPKNATPVAHRKSWVLYSDTKLQSWAESCRKWWLLPCSWSAADQMTHGGNTMLTQTCNAVEKILFSSCLFTQELGTTLAPLFWLGIHWLFPETLTATRVTPLAMLKNKHELQNPIYRESIYSRVGCWIILLCF